MSDLRKCFTFKIVGGEPFQLYVPLSPVLEHHGQMTLWKVVITPDQLPYIISFIEKRGSQVTLYVEKEEDSFL